MAKMDLHNHGLSREESYRHELVKEICMRLANSRDTETSLKYPAHSDPHNIIKGADSKTVSISSACCVNITQSTKSTGLISGCKYLKHSILVE